MDTDDDDGAFSFKARPRTPKPSGLPATPPLSKMNLERPGTPKAVFDLLQRAKSPSMAPSPAYSYATSDSDMSPRVDAETMPSFEANSFSHFNVLNPPATQSGIENGMFGLPMNARRNGFPMLNSFNESQQRQLQQQVQPQHQQQKQSMQSFGIQIPHSVQQDSAQGLFQFGTSATSSGSSSFSQSSVHGFPFVGNQHNNTTFIAETTNPAANGKFSPLQRIQSETTLSSHTRQFGSAGLRTTSNSHQNLQGLGLNSSTSAANLARMATTQNGLLIEEDQAQVYDFLLQSSMDVGLGRPSLGVAGPPFKSLSVADLGAFAKAAEAAATAAGAGGAFGFGAGQGLFPSMVSPLNMQPPLNLFQGMPQQPQHSQSQSQRQGQQGQPQPVVKERILPDQPPTKKRQLVDLSSSHDNLPSFLANGLPPPASQMFSIPPQRQQQQQQLQQSYQQSLQFASNGAPSMFSFGGQSPVSPDAQGTSPATPVSPKAPAGVIQSNGNATSTDSTSSYTPAQSTGPVKATLSKSHSTTSLSSLTKTKSKPSRSKAATAEIATAPAASNISANGTEMICVK
ncbi:hypothetical protein BC830DRAFT_341543 [Chytriomyces sp. MP71]|nr:hypothetical protein BC830DRAFT_341543 [Chytriomyces sp. MP71]